MAAHGSADLNLIQVLFATGDVMAQQAVERVGVDKHNFARTGRMALYGGGTSPTICFHLDGQDILV